MWRHLNKPQWNKYNGFKDKLGHPWEPKPPHLVGISCFANQQTLHKSRIQIPIQAKSTRPWGVLPEKHSSIGILNTNHGNNKHMLCRLQFNKMHHICVQTTTKNQLLLHASRHYQGLCQKVQWKIQTSFLVYWQFGSDRNNLLLNNHMQHDSEQLTLDEWHQYYVTIENIWSTAVD